jgi:hypothetical protein
MFKYLQTAELIIALYNQVLESSDFVPKCLSGIDLHKLVRKKLLCSCVNLKDILEINKVIPSSRELLTWIFAYTAEIVEQIIA